MSVSVNAPITAADAYARREVKADTASGSVVAMTATAAPAPSERGKSSQFSRRYSSGSGAAIVKPASSSA